VSVQGSDTPGYVIKVGEATDVLTTEMRNKGEPIDRAGGDAGELSR